MKQNPAKWKKKLGLSRKKGPRRQPKYLWTPEHYKTVVEGGIYKGTDGKPRRIHGLRELAFGFDKRDGYSSDPARWTKGAREKVRDYFHRVEILSAQSHQVKKLKQQKGESKREFMQRLDTAKKVFHRQVPGDFKAIFVPDTDPRDSGFKPVPMKLRFLKDRVIVERPTIYKRIEFPFDKKALVRDARGEIKRVSGKMKDATLFAVQVGQFQTKANSLFHITQDILYYMEQYDGKKPIPTTSGNVGDNPKHHHWSMWLDKLVGYELPRHGRNAMMNMARMIAHGMAANQDREREKRNYMKRTRMDARQMVRQLDLGSKRKRKSKRKGRK